MKKRFKGKRKRSGPAVVSVSKLYGFAVDLRREAIVRVKYDPYRLGRTASPASILPTKSLCGAAPRDPYPAQPDPDLCPRCPYASMCAHAVFSGETEGAA